MPEVQRTYPISTGYWVKEGALTVRDSEGGFVASIPIGFMDGFAQTIGHHNRKEGIYQVQLQLMHTFPPTAQANVVTTVSFIFVILA